MFNVLLKLKKIFPNEELVDHALLRLEEDKDKLA